MTSEGWLYLAAIVDLHSRLVVGWAMAATKDAVLVDLALHMAVASRHPDGKLSHHSDRGSELSSGHSQAALREVGIEVCMSRTSIVGAMPRLLDII